MSEHSKQQPEVRENSIKPDALSMRSKENRAALAESVAENLQPATLDDRFINNMDKDLLAIGQKSLAEFEKSFDKHAQDLSPMAKLDLRIIKNYFQAAIFKMTNDFWRRIYDDVFRKHKTDRVSAFKKAAEKDLSQLVFILNSYIDKYTSGGAFSDQSVNEIKKGAFKTAHMFATSNSEPLKDVMESFISKNKIPSTEKLKELSEEYLTHPKYKDLFLTFLTKLPAKDRIYLLQSPSGPALLNAGTASSQAVFSAVEVATALPNIDQQKLEEIDKKWQISNQSKYPSSFDGRGAELNFKTLGAFGLQAWGAATIGANVMANLVYNRRELLQNPLSIISRAGDLLTNEMVWVGAASIVGGSALKDPKSFTESETEGLQEKRRFLEIAGSLHSREIEKFIFTDDGLMFDLLFNYSTNLKAKNDDQFPKEWEVGDFEDFLSLYKKNQENGEKTVDKAMQELLQRHGITTEAGQKEALDKISKQFQSLKYKHKLIDYLKVMDEQNITSKNKYFEKKMKLMSAHA